MQQFLNLAIVVATFISMEAFSWFIHKYLFHGPLWFIHKTHHRPRSSHFEFNDVFSLAFAGAAIWLIIAGLPGLTYQFWIGIGITLYGVIYFVFHDVFIHRRVTEFKSGNRYLLAIRRAHKIHHKSQKKNPSEEFGLLSASPKYFRKARQKHSQPNEDPILRN